MKLSPTPKLHRNASPPLSHTTFYTMLCRPTFYKSIPFLCMAASIGLSILKHLVLNQSFLARFEDSSQVLKCCLGSLGSFSRKMLMLPCFHNPWTRTGENGTRTLIIC